MSFFNSHKIAGRLMMAGLMAGAAVVAQADTTLTWTLPTSSTSAANPTIPNTGNPTVVGAALATTPKLTSIAAYANSGTGGLLVGGTVYAYSGGIGAVTTGEASNTSPEHATDNFSGAGVYRIDSFLFTFDNLVTLTQVTEGWLNSTTSTDITVLAYTGSGAPTSLTTKTYDKTKTTGLTNNGWTKVGGGQYGGTAPNTTSNYVVNIPNTTAISSKYWIVSAYNPLVDAGTACSAATCDDAWKLKALTMTVVSTGTSSVPEPGVLVLMGTGFGLLAHRVRSNRRRMMPA